MPSRESSPTPTKNTPTAVTDAVSTAQSSRETCLPESVPVDIVLSHNRFCNHLRRMLDSSAKALRPANLKQHLQLRHLVDSLLSDILTSLLSSNAKERAQVYKHMFRLHCELCDASTNLNGKEIESALELIEELANNVESVSTPTISVASVFSMILREHYQMHTRNTSNKEEDDDELLDDGLWDFLMERETAQLKGTNQDGVEDELYLRAVDLVTTERKASTSLLQRHFSIGYGRASRLLDLLQERGIISPPKGATRDRDILVVPPSSPTAPHPFS